MPVDISLQESFGANGFAILPDVVPDNELEALRAEADRLLGQSSERGGARNVLSRSSLFRDLASSAALLGIVEEFLGPEARPTKLTVFDKTTEANWKVPWHQDLTITVHERVEVPGYGP